jgi:hypothetical protein
MTQQQRTFKDFMALMFDATDLVWVGKGTKEKGCIFRPRSIIMAASVTQGHNFFTPNSFQTTESRTDANAILHTLFAEGDSVSLEEQRETAKKHREILTAVVSSGGKSLHVFSRLDSPFTSEIPWLRYQLKLCYLFSGDRRKKNPAAVMRLPFATRQDKDGFGNEQELRFLSKKSGARRSRAAVCQYLDQLVPDSAIKASSAPAKQKNVKLYVKLSPERIREITRALKQDANLKRLITKLETEKGKGDELGLSICYHLFWNYGWMIDEMIYILKGSRKAKNHNGAWPANSAVYALQHILKKHEKRIREHEKTIRAGRYADLNEGWENLDDEAFFIASEANASQPLH